MYLNVDLLEHLLFSQPMLNFCAIGFNAKKLQRKVLTGIASNKFSRSLRMKRLHYAKKQPDDELSRDRIPTSETVPCCDYISKNCGYNSFYLQKCFCLFFQLKESANCAVIHIY